MEKLYPLTFRPNIHTALWGCESWEISGHPSSPSVVAAGALAGRTLEELASAYGAALTGTKAPAPTRFPLLFKVIDAREGMTLFIPGGLVHAIGEDVRIYEVQQSSNTTYRLYDWGRVGADGMPRQLHVAESLKTIDFSLPVPEARGDVSCEFFSFRSVLAQGELEVAPDPATFTAVYIVNENRSVLVPAGCAARIACSGKVLVTTL